MSEKIDYCPPELVKKYASEPHVNHLFENYIDQCAPGFDFGQLDNLFQMSRIEIAGHKQSKDIISIMSSFYISITALATASVTGHTEIISQLPEPWTFVCGYPAIYLTWMIWASEAKARALHAAKKELNESIVSALKSEGVLK